MKTRPFILLAGIVLMLMVSNCTTIRPGEAGLKQRYGVLQPGMLTRGLKVQQPSK